jgi:LuxR family transcriptional regulator
MSPAERIRPSAAFEARIDQAWSDVDRFGMVALIYDYAPVAFRPDGEIIAPSIFGARNMPSDMPDLWYGGFYRRDTVQHLALRSVGPLFWSYHANEDSALNGGADAAVAEYLRDVRRGRGITVPVHTPRKGSATITGIWSDDRLARPDTEMFMQFLFFAHDLHQGLSETFTPEVLQTSAVQLTPRERECIALCAQGFSDKQVAARLDRSLSTVVMHTRSAFRKLGARNRAQAIAHAAHYGLLD